MNALFQITAPHFCAGLISNARRVTKAAPILRWAVGKPMMQITQYCRSKKWNIVLVEVF